MRDALKCVRMNSQSLVLCAFDFGRMRRASRGEAFCAYFSALCSAVDRCIEKTNHDKRKSD
jgi:hypothetical protein